MPRWPHHAVVLTLRAAARLLARADSHSALRLLAPHLGFGAPPIVVPAPIRRELGLHGLVRRAELFEGAGPLRLLTVELMPPDTLDEGADLRERTRRAGAALARHAPTRHWCLCVLDHDGLALCIATVRSGALRSGVDAPRIAALRIDRRRVLDSDADTFRALASAAGSGSASGSIPGDDPELRHVRFTEILQRDALSMRFYRALERSVHSLAESLTPALSALQRRELALLCVSRCLFLGFLEAKGWLDDRRDFLLHHTLRVLEAGGGLHDRFLRPLFFGTLNTPRRSRAPAARQFGRVPFLNGGLFAPTALERRAHRLNFSDEALTTLITGVLDRYRFTAHEDSTAWSEAAVDPEMLGRAFENLMAPDERHRSGAYYTPPHLVDAAISEALVALLPSIPPALLDEHLRDPLPIDGALTVTHRLSCARVLDPACGSGAFLVRTLERFDALLRRAGDQRPTHERRRALLTQSIFGVDRDPMAVWLCELRLWLSVVIECHDPDIEHLAPLPNLDHHIRIGDSLAGGTFRHAPPAGRVLTSLRTRYSRASGARKLTIASALDQEERRRSIAELSGRLSALRHERRQLLLTLRGRDLFGQRTRASRADRARLETLRVSSRELVGQRQRLQLGGALPFRFGAMFADVGAASGFCLVVGNPPWVRPHALRENDRQWLRHEFRTMRQAGWRSGAARAGAGAGFAAQADLAVAFVERSIQLLAPNGTLALLVPAKLWRTLSGGGIRRLLQQDTTLRALHDWSDAPAQFEAATYPSLIVATKRPRLHDGVPRMTAPALLRAGTGRTAEPVPVTTNGNTSSLGPTSPSPALRITVVRRSARRFFTHADTLPLEDDGGAPWLLLPPEAREAFHLLRHAGQPLSLSPIGRPLLGVKCGCNAAFLVEAVEHDDDSATVTSLDVDHPRQGVIERHLLRPALRGESVPDSLGVPAGMVRDRHPDLRIIWTHGRDGGPLSVLPPASARWLAQWRPRLQARRDARRRAPWWTLFRTEAARSDLPRVVWADIGKRLRTQVLAAGDPTIPLNSCYVVRVPSDADAFALHALLQSSIAAAWLDPLAEPARGGFRRFLGWTVASLPVPHDWARATKTLAPLGERLHRSTTDCAPTSGVSAGATGTRPSASDTAALTSALDEAVAESFGLRLSDLQPLLDWYRHV